MLISRVLAWLKRKPGKIILAQWRVEPELWRQFAAFEAEHGAGEPYRELPLLAVAPPDGVEILFEPHAVWIAGKRASLPLRGAPEVLSAEILETAHNPTTLEFKLKYPPYGRPSGGIAPARYTRLAVPIPRTAWRDGKTVASHFNRDVPGTPDFFHGRGDGSDPEDLSRCWSCGKETHKFRSQCERCGATLQSRRWSRRFGLLLMPCGLFITAVMVTVLNSTLALLLHPGVTVDGSTFNGSGATAAAILAVFVAVLAFGVGAFAYGAWQVTTGKRSLRVATWMVGVAGGLITFAGLVAWLLRL